MTICLYYSKNWQGKPQWPSDLFTMSLRRKWIDVSISVNWIFFTYHSFSKTKFDFYPAGMYTLVNQAPNSTQTSKLLRLWPFKREHSVCKTGASLNTVFLCGYFRGYKTPIVLRHQHTAANCKRCSGLFHGSPRFSNKKELTEHFLGKKCFICIWIYPINYIMQTASQAMARKRAVNFKPVTRFVIRARYLSLTSNHCRSMLLWNISVSLWQGVPHNRVS